MCTHSGELSQTADCRLWRWEPSCCRCPRRPGYHRQLPSSGYWALPITHSSSVHKEGLILPRSAGYATLFFPTPRGRKIPWRSSRSKGDEPTASLGDVAIVVATQAVDQAGIQPLDRCVVSAVEAWGGYIAVYGTTLQCWSLTEKGHVTLVE